MLPDGTQAVFEPAFDGAWILWACTRGERRAPRHVLVIRALGADASARCASPVARCR